MSQTPRRGVGRPRANREVPDLPARDDILKACAELFAVHGFKGTSTRMIADRVGIRQPSLFHHFPKKADILDALITSGGKPIIEFVDQIDFSADPRQQLYDLILFDCHFLLTEPLRINRIMSLPEVRNGPLGATVEQGRNRIIDAYRQLISAGADQQLFIVHDLEVVCRSIFGLGESTWDWYSSELQLEPVAVAREVADLGLRALGVGADHLEALHRTTQVLGE